MRGARAPKIGMQFLTGGGFNVVGSYTLYQPGAPNLYEVYDPQEKRFTIRRAGDGWRDVNLDEAQGGHGALDKQPAAGSIPASSTSLSSGGKAEHLEAARPPRDERPAGHCLPEKSVRASSSAAAPKDSRRSVRPAPSSEPSAFQAASRAGFGRRRRSADLPTPGAVNLLRPRRPAYSLHEKLDEARDLYQRAAERVESSSGRDLAFERFGIYTELIAQVAAADPEFYRGRR